MKFNELGLCKELLDGIESLGFEEPTPIQQEVIPFMLENPDDLVALAQTGTGKTGAFGLPMLEKIEQKNRNTQALILCPTRELCMQIAYDLQSYAKKMSAIRILALYGGADIRPQLAGLDQGAQLIVATPGRLLDLLSTRKAKLDAVERLVLDEADEMLNMGFERELNEILDEIPKKAQRLLFSATMPQRVQRMMHDYLTEPHEISIGERNRLSELVEHQVMLVHAKDRYAGLRRMLDATPGLYGIIFCRTRADTQMVADRLSNDGFNIDALHGDLLHEEREVVMKKFRTRQINLLVATDVAARGLHINDLSHVIHYSIPEDQNTYTHRSGRTGRAGKTGISMVIIHAREKFKLERIEKVLGQEFEPYAIPTGETIERIQLQRTEGVNQARQTIEFYRATPELSTTPEKIKPKQKTGPSITGREAREKHVPRKMTEGMIELVVNLGKRNELNAERLGELINGCGQTVKLGRINMVEMQTYVEVPYSLSNEIINHFKQTPTEFGGRPVNLAFAGNAKPAEPKEEKSRDGKRPFGRKKNY